MEFDIIKIDKIEIDTKNKKKASKLKNKQTKPKIETTVISKGKKVNDQPKSGSPKKKTWFLLGTGNGRKVYDKPT